MTIEPITYRFVILTSMPPIQRFFSGDVKERVLYIRQVGEEEVERIVEWAKRNGVPVVSYPTPEMYRFKEGDTIYIKTKEGIYEVVVK